MATPSEKEIFSALIENRISEQKITVIEAIMDYCETSGLEVELAATLLNDALKEKLEYQSRRSNLLKKDPQPTSVKKKGKKK